MGRLMRAIRRRWGYVRGAYHAYQDFRRHVRVIVEHTK